MTTSREWKAWRAAVRDHINAGSIGPAPRPPGQGNPAATSAATAQPAPAVGASELAAEPVTGAVAIYHVMLAHESFDEAAGHLIECVRAAATAWPGKPRSLYLDIDGHRNDVGGFDTDAYELQRDFVLGFLNPWLTRVSMPLLEAQCGKPQREDVPEELAIQPAAR